MSRTQRVWFERKFALGTPIESIPEILERLRGTPARIEERVRPLPTEELILRPNENWSIQEHVGHLADLEPLWMGRVDDLMGDEKELRSADLKNTATWQAEHNKTQIGSVLAEFRARRAMLVERIESFDETRLRTTALHPRLLQPMTVVDLGFFVAEHDDHHLATVSTVIGTDCQSSRLTMTKTV